MSKYGVFSGPYFPVFGPNPEIYEVNLRIQSEYRKMWTRKKLCIRTFFHAVLAFQTFYMSGSYGSTVSIDHAYNLS